MGDRTTVTLTVLASQTAAAKALFNGELPQEEVLGNGDKTDFVFYEVNYGNLHFLNNLRDAGIAFDSRWDAGGEYGPGVLNFRYTSKGEPKERDLYDDGIDPELNTLLELIDKPTELRQAILDHAEKVQPWDFGPEQEEFGKLYQTMKIIGLSPSKITFE